MKVAGLFAGVGGIEAGFAAAGHRAELFCEISEPARAVLAERFADVEVATDVTRLAGLPAAVDLLAAGFPCQDLSQAGMTAGLAGVRSGLVSHVFRLLDRHRTPWVVLENVSFMLHLDRGAALRRLVEAFEERGYRWAYRVVNSLAYLPQRRERVLLVATRTGVDPADVLLTDDVRSPDVQTALDTHAHGFYWTEGIRGLGWAADAIPTLKNGSTIGIPSAPAILLPDGTVVTPDVRDAERLQGFPEGWTEPAERNHRASIRWSLLGNAVTVSVAAWLGRRLAAPLPYDIGRDGPLDAHARWPRAARWDGSRRRAVSVGPFPEWLPRPPLAEFLHHRGRPLSARAARGFLERTDRGRLRFVPGFRERVRAHMEAMESAAARAEPGGAGQYGVAAE